MLDGFHQQVSGVLRVRLDMLEDEGSALPPDVSAMASPGKESKPHQIPPKTAKPVMLPGQLSPAHFPGLGQRLCRCPVRPPAIYFGTHFAAGT